MSDEDTLQVYARKAQDYAEMVKGIAAKDPLFKTFIAALPPGSAVLDLGCGPGHYAARMADEGLKVTAYDPVPQMVALAGQHQGVTAREAGFGDVSGIGLYEGVWANFSLLHAARDDMPRHLDRIHEALKAEGLLHVAVKTGEGERRDGLGRLYTYYAEDELRSLLEEAGFVVESVKHGEDAGLSGEVAPWVAMLSRA